MLDPLFGRNMHAHVDVDRTSSGPSANQVQTQVEFLEDRLDRLALVSLAMWSLLQQTANLTEEDLMERVKQIDLLDGQADGKVTRQAVKCPKCQRVMSTRHQKCIYCGAPKPEATAFDPLL